MKIWIVTLLIGFNSLDLKSQEERLQLVKSFGETSKNISCFTIDNQNNIIVAISFSDSIDADLGLGKNWLYEPDPIYKNSLLIAKYNPDFELIWTGLINGSVPGQGLYLLTDQSNNIFLSLRFEDSVDADPSPGKVSI